jgi:hypothetical protein
MKIVFAPELVSSYKRLSYKVWFAIAEFVDNSTQAYQNSKKILDKSFKNNNEKLEVKITYHVGANSKLDYFEIEDNSIGMSLKELEQAFKIGSPPKISTGRSKYGLGMKTAAFWLGDNWSVTTKKLNDPLEYTVNLDLRNISKGNLDLSPSKKKVNRDKHYTIIRIDNLHRRYVGQTIGKIKSFLSSIYRMDIKTNTLNLSWNGDELKWCDYVDEDFILNKNNVPYKRNFKFSIGKKKVSGWAGVLKSGGRSKGGFALFQSNRVIQSPPNGYKPEGIFGEQEGGRNDLINQRLVGEINLDGFEVSHTKDYILWDGTDGQKFDKKITEEIGDLKKVATDYRLKAIDERAPSELDFESAFDEIIKEIQSGEVDNVLTQKEIPPDDVITESNNQVEQLIIAKTKPTIIKLNNLSINLYIDEEMSINDPYVVHNSTSSKNSVIVIVNKNHPYWNELEGSSGILNYLRQCIYDGVAEWKAYFSNKSTRPDTIKYIKDNLLRVPFEIEKSDIF